jgi:metal-sulfur cluster biosynthetic enzyme/Fe-S cluster assembly iron-binding protein IscA
MTEERARSGESADPRTATVRLRLQPAARDALAAALEGRPSGSGVRIWVERGMRPHAQMMIDRASHRDVPLELGGVPLLLDESSLPFLRDAEVRYRTDQDPAGFEVVGPFLPTGPVPEPAEPSPTAGPPESRPPAAAAASDRAAVEEKIRAALKNIYDPEIPMNVIDLGLIYGMEWTDRGDLTIRMTLTSPGCPAVEAFTQEVTRAARDASGLPNVKVDIVWEPPWGPDRMSDFARRQFGYA